MSADYSLQFKEIYPTEESFLNDEECLLVKKALEKFGYEEEKYKEIYRLIFRRYKFSEILFDNQYAFSAILFEKLEILIPNYFTRKKQYDKIMQMSDKELMNVSSEIFNMTENTNERYEDPFEAPLKNITNQNARQEQGDKLSRLRFHIQSLQMNLINDLLNPLKPLFINAMSRIHR